MPLTLKITLFNGQPYSNKGGTVVFNENGGNIGRSDVSSLTLLDENKMISRRHAEITFENGKYLLTDCSLAGTFIDDAVEPIENGLKVELIDGMKIRIGEYTIDCQLSDSEPPSINTSHDDFQIKGTSKRNPFAEDGIVSPIEESGALDIVENDFQSPFLTEGSMVEDVDILDSADVDSEPSLLSQPENNGLLDSVSPDFNDLSFEKENSLLTPKSNGSNSIEHGLIAENISSLNDSFVPSEPIKETLMAGTDEMPDDFNFEDLFNLNSSSSELEPEADKLIQPIQDTDDIEAAVPNFQSAPINVEKQPEPTNNPQLLDAFLRGAKVDPKEVADNNPEEQITRIGAMFRQFVQSTISVLRSRAEFKSLFRVSVTTIKMDDNNPLKFAVTTDEAIKQLIKDGQGGFKKSVESIDEGFADLLNHQLAMQAGIQASLADVLKRFDPALIEQQYSEGIFLQKKAKCWDQYLNIYMQLSESAIEDFYGDAFAEAYEKQMRLLKNNV